MVVMSGALHPCMQWHTLIFSDITQTDLSVGFLAVFKGWTDCLLGLPRVGAIPKLCTGCGDRDTCSRLACTKWSVAPLLTVKLNGFGTFSFQDPLQPPIATLATQMPPDAPPDALKITVWVLALGSYIYIYI